MTHPALAETLSSESSIAAFTNGFIDKSLDASVWHHEAHCLVTTYLVLTRPRRLVEKELPGQIMAYNLANGGENTDTSGYHHTITIFYIRAIADFVGKLPQNFGVRDCCATLLTSEIASKDYVLNFYSPDVLFSVPARRGWVTPDLEAARTADWWKA